MSDRTRVSGHGEGGVTADDDAATTRADRIMGREGDGRSGSARSGPSSSGSAERRQDPRSNGTGSARTDRPGAESPASDPQRPTSVPGPAGSADPVVRRRPADGWGRSSGAASRESTPAEDETPTRVNPVVPSFRTPASGATGSSSAGSATSATAAGGTSTSPSTGTTSSTPPGTTASTTSSTTAKTAVGSGSLGAVVTESMEAPPADPSTEPVKPQARTKPRKARRARLRLSRIDPWSMMKTSFLFSIALGIAAWVAVAFVWWVIQQSGLFTAVNETVSGILQTPGDADPFRLEAYVNGSRVLGLTALLAVVDVILITALMTVASFLYNLSATMLGGLQLTLAETDD